MRSILTSKEYSNKNIIIPFVGVLIFPLIAWLFPLFAMVIFTFYLTTIFIIGFQGAKKAKKGRFLLLIPGLFIIEHLSYFLGMLYGVTKGKWKKEKGDCKVFYHTIITK